MVAVPAAASTGPSGELLRRAKEALQRHGEAITSRNTIAVADFSTPSAEPRFHLVSTASGAIRTLLVAHGRGSDPEHSGLLQRFSNAPGSYASSAGTYLIGATYAGKHGPSRRLLGLDPQNSNAEARAIVIHAAAYVSADMARNQGKIGRSEGCFAVAEVDLPEVLQVLMPGAMLYADKI
ncbi:MAG: murein L,D-transpeptidase catalytic domain family protein [Pseudomonadota bacterium]